MTNINMFALGGQDENGKNLFVVEKEKDIYIFNCGIKFPINDLWGVDGIIPNIDYLKKYKDRIKGLFITHAHDDSFAALPWILMELEGLTIYGSKFTIAAAKNRISKYKIGHSKYKFVEIKDKLTIGQTEVKAFPVATSIPGAFAYSLNTKQGDIVFMSNAIIDKLDIFGNTDLQAMKKAMPNVLALITDSGRANFPGHAADKKSLTHKIENKFKSLRNDQRILFGAFDEEMYNIQEVIKLANKYNRPVAFYGSAFSSLYLELVKQYPSIERPKKIIDYKVVNQTPNAVVLVTGTWSRLNDRFNRISGGKDVYLKLKSTDAIIMFTPPQNGMEVSYSVALDNITMIAPDITSIEDKDVFPMKQAYDDIKEFANILKPKFFIPTSSLYRYQVEATKAAVSAGVRRDRTLVLPNGKIAHLADGELASRTKSIHPFGDVLIQGYGVGDISYEVIRERKNLSSGGLVSIGVQYDRRAKQLVGKMNIQIVGVVVKEELPQYQTEVQNVVIQKFEGISKFDYRELQNAIRKRVQKIFMKRTNKEPLVVITFYEV